MRKIYGKYEVDGVLTTVSTVPAPPTQMIVCSNVRDFIEDSRRTQPDVRYDFIHADPPWSYHDTGGRGGTRGLYQGMGMDEITGELEMAYDVAAEHSYLALWATGPTLGDFFGACEAKRRDGCWGRWQYLGLGSWQKTQVGVGSHWRGKTEPVLLYRKGKPAPYSNMVESGWVAPRGGHSEKPQIALCDLLKLATEVHGCVLDLYAGDSASMARACYVMGRSCVSVESDANRCARARDILEAIK